MGQVAAGGAAGALLVAGAVAGLVAINPASSAGRIMVWELTLPMIGDHPLFGVGQGRYGLEYLSYQARYFAQPENQAWTHKAASLKQAHSEYLQAFAETGVPGGLLFAAIWVYALWQMLARLFRRAAGSQQGRVAEAGVAAVLLVLLVHAFVDTPLHVLPLAAIAYAALGFVPAREATREVLRSRRVQGLLLVGLLGIAGLAAYKMAREYPAYRRWQRGQAHARWQEWKQAAMVYQRALGRLPRKGELQFHFGAALTYSGAYAAGVRVLQRSLKGFSDRNIYLTLSYAQLKLGHLQKAERRAKTALRMFPEHLSPHLMLGMIYHRQGRDQAAKAALRRCIQKDTYVQSQAVRQVALDARRLWNLFYEKPPP